MGTIPITAPDDRAVTVVVFEPRQTPEQSEVEIDRFDLKAGEYREYEIRSATAAYRTIPQAVDEEYARKAAEPKPAQEPIHGEINPYTADEVDAGKKRMQEHEQREKRLAKAQEPDKKPAAPQHRAEAKRPPAASAAPANAGPDAAGRKAGEPQPQPTGPTNPDPLKDQRNAPEPRPDPKKPK